MAVSKDKLSTENDHLKIEFNDQKERYSLQQRNDVAELNQEIESLKVSLEL